MRIKELLEEVSAASSFLQAMKRPEKDNKPTSSPFKSGIKQGYEKTKSKIDNLPYTKLGKASQGFAKWARDVNRGFRR